MHLNTALVFFAFFKFISTKKLKMHISTSIWSAQYPNADRNIQHINTESAQLPGTKFARHHFINGLASPTCISPIITQLNLPHGAGTIQQLKFILKQFIRQPLSCMILDSRYNSKSFTSKPSAPRLA